jgi:hypothetical protein
MSVRRNVMGLYVSGAKRPWEEVSWGELSMDRVVHEVNVFEANCLWGVRGAKCPWGRMSAGRVVHGRNVQGMKFPWGEM